MNPFNWSFGLNLWKFQIKCHWQDNLFQKFSFTFNNGKEKK